MWGWQRGRFDCEKVIEEEGEVGGVASRVGRGHKVRCMGRVAAEIHISATAAGASPGSGTAAS